MVRQIVRDPLFLQQKSLPATREDKQVMIDLIDTFLLLLLISSIGASGQVTVTATKYHPGMGGAGWVTASGSRIDNNKLKNYEIKWIALSHDMFQKLGVKMGDEVVIECANSLISGVWKVMDKMGPRLRNRIDILLPRGDKMNFHAPMKVQIRKR